MIEPDFSNRRPTTRPRTPGLKTLLWAAPLLWALASTLSASTWQAKVDPLVLEETQDGEETEFLVFLEDQAELHAASLLSTKEEKGHYVFEQLRAAAARSQGPLIRTLDQAGRSHRSFWIANMIWVEGDWGIVQQLANRADVAHLYANPWVALSLPETPEEPDSTTAPLGIEWNISHIGAPDFWAAGFSGQGVVIAGQDTGYDWDHPALKDQYRGWMGLGVDHDYNWHDSIHSGGSSCGADSPEPCDDRNHGTHTMGTMVGDDGGSNQIGVAPGARWIGCRNMDNGNGTPTTYSECFEFFLAPTRVDGTDPDPGKAPHVINNSWICPPTEGCTDPNVLRTVVENTRAAGIVVVASAGNDGLQCSSINSPPAIYEASITVGATDSNDIIAGFSSRGGVNVDGSGRLKPNVTAPGVGIRSSVNGGGYQDNWSGTSMAGPHVAGQVALLISADSALAGRTDALQACMEGTAIPLTTTQDCSGTSGDQIPNNTYGWGRIELSLPLALECAPGLIFADGFESGTTSNWN